MYDCREPGSRRQLQRSRRRPTSNIGSRWILDPDLTEVEMNHRVMEAMRATFKPEFLNRVDDIVIFHRLSLEHIRKIVEIQLGQLRARLADRDIALELSEEAILS